MGQLTTSLGSEPIGLHVTVGMVCEVFVYMVNLFVSNLGNSACMLSHCW